MRLLHTTTLQPHEFSDHDPGVEYAILSHTWDAIELSFQDLSNPDIQTLSGYTKIKETCNRVKNQYKWVWIDTCCIDKSSSAEVSQAINSMYLWYENSDVCYVYLADFEGKDLNLDKLRSCKWFTRGWTLQELIAPSKVIFWNSTWSYIGEREQLAFWISTITGIPRRVLSKTSS